MTEPDAPLPSRNTESAEPTRHRAAGPASGVGARLLAPVTAVVVVIAVVVVLILINGHSTSHSTATSAPPPLQIPSAAPSGSSHHAGTAAPTHHHHHATASPSASASATATTDAAEFAPVEVLNNSTRHGLAHLVASQVAAKGWQVYFVGNLRGRIRTSTVYFAPGEQSAARHLASQFPSVARVLPNAEGGLHTRDLTLVLTRFWSE